MKRSSGVLLIGGLVVGGVVLYLMRGKLAALFTPQPDTTTLLQSQYGGSLDVPATIAGTTGAASNPIAAVLGIVDVLSGQGSSGSASYQNVETGAAPPSLGAGITDPSAAIANMNLLGADSFMA